MRLNTAATAGSSARIALQPRRRLGGALQRRPAGQLEADAEAALVHLGRTLRSSDSAQPDPHRQQQEGDPHRAAAVPHRQVQRARRGA
jgi:hypothetical protein